MLTSPSGWSRAVPMGTDQLYSSSGIFEVQGTTGTDTTVTWSAPQQQTIDGATGTAGTDGLSVYQANIYRRSGAQFSNTYGWLIQLWN